MAIRQVDHPQFIGADSEPTQWFLLFRSIFCGGLAGILAGVVFLGIGSRIFMRVVTLLNAETEGALTDAGQLVGDFTFQGTFILVIFVGGFGGIFAGGIWIVVRERLPEHLFLRIPLAGMTATLVGSFVVIEASNSDFTVFAPVGLNVAMFMMLVMLTGSATAYGDWILQRRLPSKPDAGEFYASMVGVGAFVAIPLIFVFFFVGGAVVQDPPRVAGGFFSVAAVGALLSWTRYTPWGRFIPSKAGTWIGTIGCRWAVGVRWAALGGRDHRDS